MEEYQDRRIMVGPVKVSWWSEWAEWRHQDGYNWMDFHVILCHIEKWKYGEEVNRYELMLGLSGWCICLSWQRPA